jgi:hypothetical protein
MSEKVTGLAGIRRMRWSAQSVSVHQPGRDVQAERDEMSGSGDTQMYRQVRDAARRLTERRADFGNDQLRAGSRQGIDVQVVRAGSGAV